ncbi:cysteine desulfurase/selenocysteine lyase [Litorivivens lipolytica]|uniref:Cysteine desulfurase n=1 Tax=Litorivivens lipolytica TaxID=1524264 RepID=A0A7W4W2Z3_9GAMM|nr:cysteine desulfurase [Litorivivens lipolytica]MBB3045944.1 cysteine desulfurase/selenocysteine lyase [Litorivivens lipolytica]
MSVAAATMTGFDAKTLRADFPALQQEVNGQPLIYLDNAATTQKPQAVIDALSNYYSRDNSNVHRGAHALSDRATVAFEDARKKVVQFLNAGSSKEVLWTRGTTESINLVASSYARSVLKEGDRILVSAMEHHSNIVPWQLAAQTCGAEVVAIPVSENGEVELDAYKALLDERVKLVAVGHVSNALGTVNPIREMIQLAHDAGAKILIDGAQGVPHFDVDVQALDCDFYAFSGHKMYGPTGTGVLYGKEALLEQMPPYHGGGEMIKTVSFDGTTFNELPFKFEAGTPNIGGAVGLAAAVDYLQGIDRAALAAHETALMQYAHERAAGFEGLKRIGCAKTIAGAFSFLLEGVHPADVGMLLDQQGIAVRTGDHCAQPIMKQFGIPGTVRASFALYNTREDVDALFAGLEKAKTFLL